MSPAIFIERNGVLSAMTSNAYADEDDLQTLLEKYPQLLLGEQDGDAAQRYLLVEREAGVPDGDSAGDRWSIDHVFLDSEGVPTFVEVKRRKDTRIRREVVGQMLEYAANARRYWPVDRLRSDFTRTTANADVVLQEFVGPDVDGESFWRDVQTNLEAGRIRLIFVADEIPDELRTIVEFLNEQMTQTEVLAIEVRRYAGDGLITLVSSIIGNTSKAKETKGSGGSDRYSRTQGEVLEAIEARFTSATRAAVENLLDWAQARGFQIRQGSGATGACMLVLPGRDRALFTFSADGSIVFDHVRHYLRHAPFDDDSKRAELIERLDNFKPGGHAIRDRNRVSGRALDITLKDLADSSIQDRFKGFLDWALQQTSASPSK